MSRELLSKSLGEFAVIVIGVLVALAVDDFRQTREDRRQEVELLGRLRVELAADAADLGLAIREVQARLWVLDEMLAGVGDREAAARLTTARLDSLQNPVDLNELLNAAGRLETWDFEPTDSPLAPAFQLWAEFDFSDDAYREMLATGSIDIIQDEALRAAILRYYRLAEDYGGNERRAGDYQQHFEATLAELGLSAGDSVEMADLIASLQLVPTATVDLRQMQHRMRAQLFYYRGIAEVRSSFETLLVTAGH